MLLSNGLTTSQQATQLHQYRLDATGRLETNKKVLNQGNTDCVYFSAEHSTKQSCPRVGLTYLGWIGLGWVEIFQFLVGTIGSTIAKVLEI